MKRVGDLRQQAERYRRLKRQIKRPGGGEGGLRVGGEAEMMAAEMEKFHLTRGRSHGRDMEF